MAPNLRLWVLALTVLAFSLQAEETGTSEESVGSKGSVSATSHFLGSQSGDTNNPDAPSLELYRHEALIRGEYAPFSANISFTSRYTPDGKQGQNTGFTLEKKSAGFENDVWDVRLGDSYQELGRGIALSLYRDPVFGVDNTLEGGAVRMRSGGVDANLFAGRVNVWKVPLAIDPLDQAMKGRNVYLAGASLGTEIAKDTKISGHYLLTQNQTTKNDQFTFRQQTVGAAIQAENILEDVDLYGESNVLTGDHHENAQSITTGYGSYASVSWAPSPWKLKVEGKDYRSFAYEFRRPPSLEEDIIPTINYNDVSAGRVYGERKLGETGQATVFSSFLGGYDRAEHTQLYHPVVGTKFPLLTGVDMEIRSGYRWMPDNSNLSHGAVKTKIKTGKGQYFELEYRKQYANSGLATAVTEKDDRNLILAGYTFNERWSLGAGYEYIPTKEVSVGNHYANFNGTYKTGPFVGRALVGKTSGGTQCSGGVCRQVSPFTGAYLETTYTF
jgi:hypothetical protein